MKMKDLRLPELQQLAFDYGKRALKKDLVIGLIGNLGSGKTTFVKSYAKALGISKIKSPTFIIASVYNKRKPLYHLDFYRLDQVNQLEDIGLKEILGLPNRTVVIEWVDKFPSIKKLCDILITLNIKSKNTRDVTIQNN